MHKSLTLFLLASLVLTSCEAGSAEPEIKEMSELYDPPEISGMLTTSSDLFHDFGDVNIEGGLITHSFYFENEGDEAFTIVELQTSCMCTAAEVVFEDGEKSPVFGMNNSEKWNAEVQAGETFEVLVTYDPMAHGPNATGAINRSIIMTTTSNENGRTVVTDNYTGYSITQMNIKGMVLTEEDFLNSNPESDEL